MLKANTRREIVIRCVVRLTVRQTPNLCVLVLWSKSRLAFSDVTIGEEGGVAGLWKSEISGHGHSFQHSGNGSGQPLCHHL